MKLFPQEGVKSKGIDEEACRYRKRKGRMATTQSCFGGRGETPDHDDETAP